jgi:hypothetical protein
MVAPSVLGSDWVVAHLPDRDDAGRDAVTAAVAGVTLAAAG